LSVAFQRYPLPSDSSDGYEKQKKLRNQNQMIGQSVIAESYPLPSDSSDGYEKQKKGFVEIKSKG
jgi:hypothetical protein